MAAIRFELNPREVFAGFDRMERQSRTLGKAFRILKPELRADQKDHASDRTGPDGPWPARAESTAGRMRRGSKRFLGRKRRKSRRQPLGRLTTAIIYSASNAGVFATSRVPWSNIHQVGGTAGRGSKIPARPFLWLSDRIIEQARTVILRTFAYAFNGGR